MKVLGFAEAGCSRSSIVRIRRLSGFVPCEQFQTYWWTSDHSPPIKIDANLDVALAACPTEAGLSLSADCHVIRMNAEPSFNTLDHTRNSLRPCRSRSRCKTRLFIPGVVCWPIRVHGTWCNIGNGMLRPSQAWKVCRHAKWVLVAKCSTACDCVRLRATVGSCGDMDALPWHIAVQGSVRAATCSALGIGAIDCTKASQTARV